MDISATHLRAARAALFTALCVTLSAASHVLLSGMPLPVTVVAGMCAAVFVIAYALAGRERGFGPIAALLVPLELTADTAFTTGQHACYGPTGGPVTGPLRSVGVDLACAGGNVGGPLAHVPDPTAVPSAVMGVSPWLLLAAHVAIGLLAAAWLRRGEAALARLLGAVAAFTFRPLLVAVAAVSATVAPRRPSVRFIRRARTARVLPLLVHSVVRRGPPCPAPAI
ncbi:hypothetical protein [Streptomyces sp. XD-27]|uniref:hypothetical protein n=1 Tax=Streptomyces sp. XD-27 TaxID=3062779 RepID=UPI0026F478BD|nr:hypothetical protein [Streptomyces sp. XD-27]WKX69816.1 hypothetical protein Q3Y56_07745 [Streptomyces sp. XD-27]